MNKEKRDQFLIFLIISIFLLGCASQTIDSDYLVKQNAESNPVIIQSKAQIKNGAETNTVKIEIALWPKKAIRLEISGALGVSVATVLFTPKEISYALHTTKQYGVGPFHEKTLYPLFKKNIDPRIFWKLINNQPMSNLNLKCEMNDKELPIQCLSVDGTLIRWVYDEPPHKRIDIISNRFEMNWIFRDQSMMTESQNKTFVLKKPENYQEIIIK